MFHLSFDGLMNNIYGFPASGASVKEAAFIGCTAASRRKVEQTTVMSQGGKKKKKSNDGRKPSLRVGAFQCSPLFFDILPTDQKV